MSQLNRESYATGIMSEQQLNNMRKTLYSYCKVMRAPKLGAVPVVVTVLEGLILTLVFGHRHLSKCCVYFSLLARV